MSSVMPMITKPLIFTVICAVALATASSLTVAANQDRCGHTSQDPHCRAGRPEQISCFARPSETLGRTYGWVGGGAPTWNGETRYLHEGTWGRDYEGVLFPSRIWLNWWHGQRYQGGTGKYETDGPHFLEHKH